MTRGIGAGMMPGVGVTGRAGPALEEQRSDERPRNCVVRPGGQADAGDAGGLGVVSFLACAAGMPGAQLVPDIEGIGGVRDDLLGERGRVGVTAAPAEQVDVPQGQLGVHPALRLPFAFGDRRVRAVGVLDEKDQLEGGDNVPSGQVPQVADSPGISGPGSGDRADGGGGVRRQGSAGDLIGLRRPLAEPGQGRDARYGLLVVSCVQRLGEQP